MKRADLIVTHPRDIYYPYFVQLINRNRDLFDRVIVIMTQTSSDRDYTADVTQYLINSAVILKVPDTTPDWRNNAIREGLRYTLSDAVLFWEQDFLVKPGFFEELLAGLDKHDAIGFESGNRYHPACLLVKNELLNKTDKDFSVETDIGDHFYGFTKQLKEYGDCATLDQIGLEGQYHHLAGLTQNFRLDSNFYMPDEFYTYLFLSSYLEQPDDWKKFSIQKMRQIDSSVIHNTKVGSYFNDKSE